MIHTNSKEKIHQISISQNSQTPQSAQVMYTNENNSLSIQNVSDLEMFDLKDESTHKILGEPLKQWNNLVICSPTLNTTLTVRKTFFKDLYDNLSTNPLAHAHIVMADYESAIFSQLQKDPDVQTQKKHLENLCEIKRFFPDRLTVATFSLPFYHSIYKINENQLFVCDHFLAQKSIEGWLKKCTNQSLIEAYQNEFTTITNQKDYYRERSLYVNRSLKYAYTMYKKSTNEVIGEGMTHDDAFENALNKIGEKEMENMMFDFVTNPDLVQTFSLGCNPLPQKNIDLISIEKWEQLQSQYESIGVIAYNMDSNEVLGHGDSWDDVAINIDPAIHKIKYFDLSKSTPQLYTAQLLCLSNHVIPS